MHWARAWPRVHSRWTAKADPIGCRWGQQRGRKTLERTGTVGNGPEEKTTRNGTYKQRFLCHPTSLRTRRLPVHRRWDRKKHDSIQ